MTILLVVLVGLGLAVFGIGCFNFLKIAPLKTTSWGAAFTMIGGIALAGMAVGLLSQHIKHEGYFKASINRTVLDAEQETLVKEAETETASLCSTVFIRVIRPLYAGQPTRVVLAGEEVYSLNDSSFYLALKGNEIQIRRGVHPREGPDPLLRKQGPASPWHDENCKDNPSYQKMPRDV